MYQVKPKNINRFKHDFERLEKREREKVWQALKTLTEIPVPPNAICLEKNYYRLKIDNIRILYQILDEKIILIGAIVKRNENTYKNWKKYFK
ncbi:hypothetical protein MHOCP_06160 [Moorella humiferrea]|uniref:Plasmid stabilization system protein n=1 Tax=Neomoorella humiferrea TaxID=676965 RepID=A0A2T0AW11_9FIRM|nr:type II toxin-antitoxin system RelE/ParE family toxin [Moorella humiferrea]PRR74886.1 hypothetical protein MOHU_03840 [Moorella humiferrea]